MRYNKRMTTRSFHSDKPNNSISKSWVFCVTLKDEAKESGNFSESDVAKDVRENIQKQKEMEQNSWFEKSTSILSF